MRSCTISSQKLTERTICTIQEHDFGTEEIQEDILDVFFLSHSLFLNVVIYYFLSLPVSLYSEDPTFQTGAFALIREVSRPWKPSM